MAGPSELGKVGNIVGLGIIGYFVGAFTIGYLFYPKERLYTSRAVVEGHDTPGRKVSLAPIHAGQIVRNQDLTSRWECSADEALQGVLASTKITATSQGVEILVTNRYREDARDIAEEAARLFRSMDREAELEGVKPVSPLSFIEKETQGDELHFLKFMLEKDAESAGIDDFEKVPTLAAQGSSGAAKLWTSADFKRRWERYQTLSKEADRLLEVESGPPPTLLVKPVVASRASNVRTPMAAGGLIGVVAGVGLGLWVNQRAARRKTGNSDVKSAADSDEHDDEGAQADPATQEARPVAWPGSSETDW